jgi:hypothetical protein
MKLTINYQETYSRSELLLRSFFGVFYLVLPHIFLLMFVQLWASILQFLSFWIILFTGRFPESFFEFQVKTLRWNLRLNARIWNISDGYPTFGLDGTDEFTSLEVPYNDSVSRGNTLIVALFGGLFVGIPHGFLLFFRLIGCAVLQFLAFWAVLFTGKYPQNWHKFLVETMRWSTRVNLYMMFMSNDYPPFNGRE